MHSGPAKTNILNSVKQVYSILKFSPKEAQAALNDLAGISQSAIMAEMMGDLSKDEIVELEKCFLPENAAGKKEMIERAVRKHFLKKEFIVKAEIVSEKVWREYAAYLRSLGNDEQREKIGQMLAGI